MLLQPQKVSLCLSLSMPTPAERQPAILFSGLEINSECSYNSDFESQAADSHSPENQIIHFNEMSFKIWYPFKKT